MTEYALEQVRAFVAREMTAAQYCMNGTWTAAEISNVAVMDNGRVSVIIRIPDATETVRITAVRLYDASGGVWLEQETDINREVGADELFFNMRVHVYCE